MVSVSAGATINHRVWSMRGTPEKYIARVYRGNVRQRYYVFKSYNTPQLFIAATAILVLQPCSSPPPPLSSRRSIAKRRTITTSSATSHKSLSLQIFGLDIANQLPCTFQIFLGGLMIKRSAGLQHRIPIGFSSPFSHSSAARQTRCENSSVVCDPLLTFRVCVCVCVWIRRTPGGIFIRKFGKNVERGVKHKFTFLRRGSRIGGTVQWVFFNVQCGIVLCFVSENTLIIFFGVVFLKIKVKLLGNKV